MTEKDELVEIFRIIGRGFKNLETNEDFTPQVAKQFLEAGFFLEKVVVMSDDDKFVAWAKNITREIRSTIEADNIGEIGVMLHHIDKTKTSTEKEKVDRCIKLTRLAHLLHAGGLTAAKYKPKGLEFIVA